MLIASYQIYVGGVRKHKFDHSPNTFGQQHKTKQSKNVKTKANYYYLEVWPVKISHVI